MVGLRPKHIYPPESSSDPRATVSENPDAISRLRLTSRIHVLGNICEHFLDSDLRRIDAGMNLPDLLIRQRDCGHENFPSGAFWPCTLLLQVIFGFFHRFTECLCLEVVALAFLVASNGSQ